MGDCGLTGRNYCRYLCAYAKRMVVVRSRQGSSKVTGLLRIAGKIRCKNIISVGLAIVVEIQISYAIGVAEPTSIKRENLCFTGQSVDPNAYRLVRVAFRICALRVDLKC